MNIRINGYLVSFSYDNDLDSVSAKCGAYSCIGYGDTESSALASLYDAIVEHLTSKL